MTDRAELAKLAKQLLYEAAASEELHPGDSCIAVMREAAAFITDQMKAATALSAEGGAGDAKMIQLGEGDWIINHGYLGEDAALFIEPSPARGTVGADARDSGLNKTSVAPGGIVIAISNLAAADVLSDELQKTIKRIGTRRGMGPLPLTVET